jgi:hypothetical protein
LQKSTRIVAPEPICFRWASNYAKNGVGENCFQGIQEMKILQIILVIAVFSALSLIVAAQPLINPEGTGCNAAKRTFMLAQSDYGGPFDLSYCQWECRMRFGFEPTGSGGVGRQSETDDGNGAYELHQSSSNYNQYAACIADCNRTFWQEFDKNTGGTGQKP